ncbi:hypothetical protein O6H91_Y209500 [Diphasiastrum complanatum]|nr:hypothetical protein O6H91_Y209500 [Diphasiastrum complanatum]
MQFYAGFLLLRASYYIMLSKILTQNVSTPLPLPHGFFQIISCSRIHRILFSPVLKAGQFTKFVDLNSSYSPVQFVPPLQPLCNIHFLVGDFLLPHVSLSPCCCKMLCVGECIFQ